VGLALHPKHEVLVAAFEGFVEELGDVAASLLVEEGVAAIRVTARTRAFLSGNRDWSSTLFELVAVELDPASR
jgi:hypothetical protein